MKSCPMHTPVLALALYAAMLISPQSLRAQQAEADTSFTEEIANRYFENPKRLMDLLSNKTR